MSKQVVCLDQRFGPKTQSVFLVVACCSLALALAGPGKKGGGEDDRPTVDVEFINFVGAKITSDGGGIYSHGSEEGVYALINEGVSNDLLFDPDRYAKRRDINNGQARFLNFSLDDPLPVDPLFECSTQISSAEFSEGAFMNVNKLGDVLASSVLGNIQFNTSLGFLRFNPTKHAGTSDVWIGRLNSCKWEITSDGTTGHVAVLLQYEHGELCEAGRFRVPIQMDVTRQNCP